MEVHGADRSGLLIPGCKLPERWHPFCTRFGVRHSNEDSMTLKQSKRAVSAFVVAGAVVMSGCAGMSQKQRGAVIGAAPRAAVGVVLGNQARSPLRGRFTSA